MAYCSIMRPLNQNIMVIFFEKFFFWLAPSSLFFQEFKFKMKFFNTLLGMSRICREQMRQRLLNDVAKLLYFWQQKNECIWLLLWNKIVHQILKTFNCSTFWYLLSNKRHKSRRMVQWSGPPHSPTRSKQDKKRQNGHCAQRYTKFFQLRGFASALVSTLSANPFFLRNFGCFGFFEKQQVITSFRLQHNLAVNQHRLKSWTPPGKIRGSVLGWSYQSATGPALVTP